MIDKKKLNTFTDFMGGYFYIDWGIDHPDYISVWETYLKEQKEHKNIKILADELQVLLQYPPKDIQEFICNECDFCLPTEKETVDWLQSFHAHLLKGISGEK